MHITEVPDRTTIQFDRTVANLLACPAEQTLRLVFEIDASADSGRGLLAAPGSANRSSSSRAIRRIRRWPFAPRSVTRLSSGPHPNASRLMEASRRRTTSW